MARGQHKRQIKERLLNCLLSDCFSARYQLCSASTEVASSTVLTNSEDSLPPVLLEILLSLSLSLVSGW